MVIFNFQRDNNEGTCDFWLQFKNKMHPYKMIATQKIIEDDVDRRTQFNNG